MRLTPTTRLRLAIGAIITVLVLGAAWYIINPKLPTPKPAEHKSASQFIAPLKQAGIKETAKAEPDATLSVTGKDRVFTFNRGYQLTIANTKTEAFKTDGAAHTVVPVPGSDAKDTVFEVTFEGEGDLERDHKLTLYSHLPTGLRVLVDNKQTLVKVYPEAKQDDLQTGYVLSFDKHANVVWLDHYYMFTDGSGFTVSTIEDAPDGRDRLTAQDSAKTFRRVFKKEREVLTTQFVLTKTP